MSKRIYNFNAGPATLPSEVLETARQEFFDYAGSGLSVMELSHRSKQYDEISEGAASLLLELMSLDDEYSVLFLGGGASTQFAMLPMNFLPENKTAAYVDTGAWAAKAAAESSRIGATEIVASSKDKSYNYIPDLSEISLPQNCAYLHLTSNNTIFGTQIHKFPDSGKIPLVCDMSSDILSRSLDFSKFDMIYAGAQKNIGPAGVTAVVIRRNFLSRAVDSIPIMLSYMTHSEKKSLYNTPPVFAIYMVRLVLQWIKDRGGLLEIEKTNVAKRERIYQLIDLHPDFYRGTARSDSRSGMNITIRLPSEGLEQQFLKEASDADMVGLKGHRSVGGIRVSLYNAMSLEGTERLADFMESFRKTC